MQKFLIQKIFNFPFINKKVYLWIRGLYEMIEYHEDCELFAAEFLLENFCY